MDPTERDGRNPDGLQIDDLIDVIVEPPPEGVGTSGMIILDGDGSVLRYDAESGVWRNVSENDLFDGGSF